MALIDEIRAKFSRNEFEFSRHAVDQTIHRNISVTEFRAAIDIDLVIENYAEMLVDYVPGLRLAASEDHAVIHDAIVGLAQVLLPLILSMLFYQFAVRRLLNRLDLKEDRTLEERL